MLTEYFWWTEMQLYYISTYHEAINRSLVSPGLELVDKFLEAELVAGGKILAVLVVQLVQVFLPESPVC